MLPCFTMAGRPPGRKYSDFITLRLDPELKASLDEAAEEEERSLGQMARIILREGLTARRKKTEGSSVATRRKKIS